MDTPLERPGRTVEVEGRLEEEEASMTGWCQVRRKQGQVEKDVAAGSRGWEEYRRKFPHVAFEQRRLWGERRWKEKKRTKAWMEGADESSERKREEELVKTWTVAQKKEVETWLRGGGEWE